MRSNREWLADTEHDVLAMRKLLLHISIGCLTFSFGVGLTQFLLAAFSSESEYTSCGAPPPQTLQLVNLSKITDEEKLLDLYREYGPAKTRHDREFFERVESNDYILFLRDRTMTREENIQWMESWPGGIFYDYDPEFIKVVGDSAVVSGWMQARYPTGEVTTLRFIDVCVRNGDNWQILSTRSIE